MTAWAGEECSAARSRLVITVRRAADRHHARRSRRDVWLTFRAEDRADPLADGFGSLETLDESRLQPGAGISDKPRHDTETITYVREGALAYEASTGHSCRSGVIQAGEFQRVSSRRAVRHVETNASRTDSAHVFKIRLCAPDGVQEPREQKRFSAAERRGVLCLIASPDARQGSLRICQDTLVFSALLDRGQHVVHALSPGRTAWLHLVQGAVSLGDEVLTTGDGAGVTAERAVSLTAREETEILLLDLCESGLRSHAARGLTRGVADLRP